MSSWDASGRVSALTSRTCTAPVPTDDFSSPVVPSAMTLPWSMTAIRSASWSASSRYWVVSRMVVPRATMARTLSHTWLRLRVEPRGGLVQEEQVGGDDEARGDVEAASHASGEGLGLPAGRLAQVEGREEFLARRAAWVREKPRSRASSSRFSAAARSSSTEAN
ncbi:hypothetical protein SVIOM342S_09854 [Streptomyces violaceorubidus]